MLKDVLYGRYKFVREPVNSDDTGTHEIMSTWKFFKKFFRPTTIGTEQKNNQIHPLLHLPYTICM